MKSPWLLRSLALAGFAISAYLLYKKASGQIDSLAGCGEDSGCANVLGSRWSQFFHIPVTVLAGLMYVGLFAATLKPSRPVYAALAICFAGAAIWFFGILLVELKEFCPWCSAAHFIGLTCAVLLFVAIRRLEKKEGDLHFGVAGGLFAVVVLCVGQLLGPIPETHAGSTETVEQEDLSVAVHARGKGRVVAVFDKKKFFNTTSLPHLGPSDAPHVIVKYFDYTCRSCRDMHEFLEVVARKHPGKFCMIMLPVPLNPACNRNFPNVVKEHEYACELARLGLAAWRAKPEAFPEVHEALFTRPVLEPEMAEIAVAQIVGEEALAKALKDPWIEEIIKADTNDFRQLISTTYKMPKLLVGKSRVLHGLTRTPEILLKELEWEFNLKPKP